MRRVSVTVGLVGGLAALAVLIRVLGSPGSEPRDVIPASLHQPVVPARRDVSPTPSLPAPASTPSVTPVVPTGELVPELALLLRDEEGVALGGVRVGTWHEASNRVDVGETDADGRATLTYVAEGDWVQANWDAELPGFGRIMTGAPAPSGGPVPMELVLPHASARVVARVVDDIGRPVEHVVLDASGPPGALKYDRRTTGPEGEASWGDAVAGTWSVRVVSVPSALVHEKDVTKVDVSRGRTTVLSVPLVRKGRVVVTRDQTDALEGLGTVHLISEARGFRGIPGRGSGDLVFLVPAGEYVLRVDMSGDTPVWIEPLLVRVGIGETVTPRLDARASDRAARGWVLDESGRPVADVGVSAVVREHMQIRSQQEIAMSMLAHKATSSGKDGGWRLAGLPEGTTFVYVDTKRAAARHLADYVASDGTRTYEIVDGLSRDITLTVRLGVVLRFDLGPEWNKRIAAARGHARLEVQRVPPDPSAWVLTSRVRHVVDGAAILEHQGAGAYRARLVDEDGDASVWQPFVVDEPVVEGGTLDVTLRFGT